MSGKRSKELRRECMRRRLTKHIYRRAKRAWTDTPRPLRSFVERSRVVVKDEVRDVVVTPTERAIRAGLTAVLRRMPRAQLEALHRGAR